MKRLKMQIELSYDEDLMYGDDVDGKEWFFHQLNMIDNLWLFASDIGDEVGTVKVISITEE